MITVAGEALIDLIADPVGHLDPRPGGGPFNVARAIARLGQSAAFLGGLSSDRFGRMLADDLDRHRVLRVIQAATAAPTTLAVVDVDPAGIPGYRFYLDGTSAAALEPGQARLPPGSTVLHVGGLGLVMEPVAMRIEGLVAALPAEVMVMLDPNCRPGAIASRHAYTARLGRVMRRTDVLKVSTEDLAYLYAGQDPADAVRTLLGQDPAERPACVLVTDGAAPVRAFAAGAEIRVGVPPVEVVDTVGAGDAFGGAFLAWWAGHGLGRAELGELDAVRAAAMAAAQAAALTCTRRGAQPPWASELAGHAGWDWLPGAAGA
ncbi:MAG: PfkB family carbohydrate kinase [Streptosporangiaceae bacterium]